MSTQAHPAFPFHLHWTPDQLAESVPLRLFEMPLFDARDDAAPDSANHAPRRQVTRSYVPRTAVAACFRFL